MVRSGRPGPDGAWELRPALAALLSAFVFSTPIARVAFSVVAFGLQRDLTYVAVTLFVLAVLLYSLGSAGR